MKTAMQELIERLKRNIQEMPNEVNSFTQGYKAGLNFVIECATTSLEKEKEQIIKNWNEGYSTGCVVGSNDYTNEDEEKDNGNYYYNETYKNEWKVK